MRVLFAVSSWRGHYFCTVPLGWALRAAGHEVLFACSADQCDAVRAAGLVAVPVLDGIDWPTLMLLLYYLDVVQGRRSGLPLHPYTRRRVRSLDEFDFEAEWGRFRENALAVMVRSYDAAVDLARRWRPDLIVHDLTAPEGMLAAEVTGVPSVWHPPGLLGTAEVDPAVDIGFWDKSGSFERYGHQPYATARIRYVVDPSPEAVVPPMGSSVRLGMRYVPYNGPAVLPGWLREPASRPRVCVLWGSSAAAEAEAIPVLRAAIEAACEHGAEVVLTLSQDQREELGELPAGVRTLTGFPLHLLLETSDAIIHHGSANTLLTAAAAGTPQLAVPYTDDRIAVSRRMTATGAVLSVPVAEAAHEEAGQLSAAVAALLTDPARRAAARLLREQIAAQPSPADLVAPLERLARTGTLSAA